MPRQVKTRVIPSVCWFAMVVSFVAVCRCQEATRGAASSRTLASLEDEVFSEINRLRSDPDDYAQRVILPLQKRLLRLPADTRQPFVEFRAFLVGGSKIDYFTLDEGGSEETARAVLAETVEALQAAPALGRLSRNRVLDRSARYFSRDFLDGGKKRDPHVDSLGRKAGPRIGHFGATRESLAAWQEFVDRLPADGTAVARVFRKNERYYWLAFTGSRAYRYWSVPDSLGEFIVKYGQAKTLARLERPGHECVINVNRQTRTLHHEQAQVEYPFPLPSYGENVAWGSWSRAVAARGLVCWWLLDPGIQDRGHRKMLLDPDYKFAGVGCAYSRRTGWVCTLDASAEELVEFPADVEDP